MTPKINIIFTFLLALELQNEMCEFAWLLIVSIPYSPLADLHILLDEATPSSAHFFAFAYRTFHCHFYFLSFHQKLKHKNTHLSPFCVKVKAI